MTSIYSESIKDTIAKFSSSSSQLFSSYYLEASASSGQLPDDIKAENTSSNSYTSILDVHAVSGFGDGGPNSSSCNNRPVFPITIWSIPKTVRIKILAMLDAPNVLVVRQVCSRLQYDIDYVIGIPAVINSDKDHFNWMRGRNIRSCYIQKLDYKFKWDFLTNPSVLRQLALGEQVTVTSETILQITKQFVNLIEYSFVLGSCTRDAFESSTNDFNSVNVEKKTIQIIESIPCVYYLKVISNPNTWKLQWTVKINHNIRLDMAIYGGNLKHISLNIPLTTKKDRSVWLDLLKHQQKLQSLVCDLGVVVWEHYAKIIYMNAESLTHIALFGTVGWDLNSAEGRPFDWTMFEDCKSLSHLEIVCDKYFNAPDVKSPYMDSINLDKLHKQKLEYLFLEYFSFQQEDITKITQRESTPKLIKGVLKNCAIHHIKISDKVLPTKNTNILQKFHGCIKEISDFSNEWESDSLESDDLREFDENAELEQNLTITEIPMPLVQGILITGWTIIC